MLNEGDLWCALRCVGCRRDILEKKEVFSIERDVVVAAGVDRDGVRTFDNHRWLAK